ncbi:Nitrilotriacetate monooxygenase component A/pristinamycin IIA synthase subunit A [Penicillium mononematosum]|uniref:Nitrilotriacetate monooxygenase component A/pristinamycin IIA synthase subunit A n=1 Tax=Penicillium mononematosum TaxID=268346 RepID=UPI002547185F|nr:Nitrilotriacetate monooxygenase component A/pristinamycin IIA synthase subunit A [Penicillium mononematosum]KAJ6188028.1 Nitrilotriacetate monooxygenase component A/pristinamycin IIA synthase subunit A [Penicillium mononematosum]
MKLPRRRRQLGTYIASDVPRPHFCDQPFLFQVGVSEAGGQFGGRHGEAIFIGGQTPECTRLRVNNIRNIANQKGRDLSHIKVIVVPRLAKWLLDRSVRLENHGSKYKWRARETIPRYQITKN